MYFPTIPNFTKICTYEIHIEIPQFLPGFPQQGHPGCPHRVPRSSAPEPRRAAVVRGVGAMARQAARECGGPPWMGIYPLVN